jgi:DNA-binding NtrC family response regulator
MRANLLLIETDHLFRMNLSRRLDGGGIQIFPADRPPEIKRLIKKQKIDVALLDLSGLKVDGLKILQMIKKLNPLVEVITLNAAGQVPLSIDAMKLGAFDDLLIPVSIDTLTERIKAACAQKRENEKRFVPKGYQKVMMAATFAEAGESETAKAYLDNPKKQSLDAKSKGERNGG